MSLLVVAFLAGILTVAAPCILPLLPVIVGGSLLQSSKDRKGAWLRPVIITGSLAISVIIFTLLLKATTMFLPIPQMIWNSISGGIVLLFGINLLFPQGWERVMITTGLYNQSNRLLGVASQKRGIFKDILIGLALGPVFSSCSPTYALIVAAILPQSFGAGLGYLSVYALGLAAILLLIAALGQTLVQKLGWLSNPQGWLRKLLGYLFVLVGIAVIFGLDRNFQAFVLEQGWYDPILHLEKSFIY